MRAGRMESRETSYRGAKSAVLHEIQTCSTDTSQVKTENVFEAERMACHNLCRSSRFCDTTYLHDCSLVCLERIDRDRT